MKTILSCVLMAYIMVMPMSVLGANITTGPSGIGNTEQLQKKGSVVDLGNIPDVLRSIRENENTMIHNLRVVNRLVWAKLTSKLLITSILTILI